jgi:chemotaxis protein methyltransferase CheR
MKQQASAADEHGALTKIAQIAFHEAGLSYRPENLSMIKSRLGPRLRQLGMKDVHAYLGFLSRADSADERREMVTALTTHFSQFFREPHHFDLLRQKVIAPQLDHIRNKGRFRLWSAGCADGKEPYSMAMTMLDLLPDAAQFDIRILATDVDHKVLARAQNIDFPADCAKDVPVWAKQGFSRRDDQFCIAPNVSALVGFKQLNLHAPWPMRRAFDAIFCRNVLIYFSSDDQIKIIKRFAAALKPGGWLFLGHSERLPDACRAIFAPAGVTSYRSAQNCAEGQA